MRSGAAKANFVSGPAGRDGTTWRVGAGAPALGLGADGDFYLNSATGDVYQRASGVYGIVANIKGAQGFLGLTGATGAAVRNGTGAPATSVGSDGDFYLDTATTRLYGPKAAGAWPSGYVTLVGPQGQSGATGPQPWKTPPAAWAASTTYTAAAPADSVTYQGSSYVCATSHTSGATFDASKWALIAQAGAASAGALIASNNLSDLASVGQAVANLEQVPSAPTASASLAVTDAERDLYPTGAITLTMPAASAGWRSGIITNDNPTSGLVTLAVPANASLDGVQNGTTILCPFQRARIRQTGASTYRTDWVDRSPIIAVRNIPFASAVAAIDFALPDGYRFFELLGKEVLPTVNTAGLAYRVSFDGGATIKADASYTYTFSGSSGNGGQSGQSLGVLTAGITNTTYPPPNFEALINPGGTNAPSGQNYPTVFDDAFYVDSNPAYRRDSYGSAYLGATGRINLIRILPNASGNISGGFILRGIP